MTRSIEIIASEFEKLDVKFSKQKFYQTSGLPYDEKVMKSVSDTLVKLSDELLNSSHEIPRSFYLKAISIISRSKKLPIKIDIYETRNSKITSDEYQFKEKPVNWGSWRQFNATASNPVDRKHLFDEFIQKAPVLAPLIMKKFDISRQVYSSYDTTPLEVYLEGEHFSFDKLRDLILSLGDSSKKVFLNAADHFAGEILGKKHFEYYDDFYVARGRVYSPLNKFLEGKDPLKAIEQVLVNWGLEKEYRHIKVDNEDREKKSPSAFCFGIQVPDDVRVVYKKVSPFSDFTSVFHEFGHAIHGRCGKPDDPYWKRYVLPRSVGETFSIFIEMLMQNPAFLKQEMNLPDEAVREILDRRHFVNLFFLVFYSANSVMKLEFWKNNYSAEQAADRFQELTKRFFWEIPGDYWLLHHVMPNYDMYSPSYILASIRVMELTKQMVDEHGEEFWRNKKAGTYFRDLAATRGSFDMSAWKMDPKLYVEEQTKFSFIDG